MTTPLGTQIRRTPLNEIHRAAGASMVSFSGWEMPQQYSSIRDEVLAVRSAAGLFDVSHMGEFQVTGPEALGFLQQLLTNDVSRLAVGRAQYSLMCTPEGGIVDDLLVYRTGGEDFLVIVNAGRIDEDWAWFNAQAAGRGVNLENVSPDLALIAFQGPAAEALLQPVVAGLDISTMRRNDTQEAHLGGHSVRISRTGYTGEDGFEILCAPDVAADTWTLLAGLDDSVRPCGLGARDVLRLESGLRLYGQDMDMQTNPYAASLAWVVKLEKGDFTGRDALIKLNAGERRRTVGLLPEGAGSIARHGAAVWMAGRRLGTITSGTFSFSLGRPIATAILDLPPTGASLEVEVRGRAVPAGVTSLPFHRRPE